MAECFHCAAQNPVGVCSRCNVLVCPDHGTRPKQFRCVSCGSATAAAGAVARSGSAELNRLSWALVWSAVDDDRELQAAARLTPWDFVSSGLSVLEGDVRLTGDNLVARAEQLSRRITERLEADHTARVGVVRSNLPSGMLADLQISSAEEAVSYAGELWYHLDDTSRVLLALSFLVQSEALPRTWPSALTVTRFSLDPDL